MIDNDWIARFDGRDAAWNAEIAESCPELSRGCRPPRWAGNAHIQNILTTWRDTAAPSAAWEIDERLLMDDGGTVSIQWQGLELGPETPVLVFLHTICGSADSLRRHISHISDRLGWVVAACNRRGHGDLPLTASVISTMGSTSDLDQQISAIERRRPGAPLYAVGVSAGSGLLVRYLGEKGKASRFKAAVAVCPAYDVPAAFCHMDPRYDRYLAKKLIEFFLRRHAHVLSDIDGYEHCANAKTLLEFHERLYPLAGYRDRESFYEAIDPMKVASNTEVPVLVINAADDPVCVEQNVHRHKDAMQELERMTLALTRYGSHCGFFESAAARTSWLHRAVAEYLTAVDRLLHGEVPAGSG